MSQKAAASANSSASVPILHLPSTTHERRPHPTLEMTSELIDYIAVFRIQAAFEVTGSEALELATVTDGHLWTDARYGPSWSPREQQRWRRVQLCREGVPLGRTCRQLRVYVAGVLQRHTTFAASCNLFVEYDDTINLQRALDLDPDFLRAVCNLLIRVEA